MRDGQDVDELLEDEDDDLGQDELDAYVRTSLGTRALWSVVFLLGGLLLLALLTVASLAIVSPQLFLEPCQRAELVTPAGCGTGSAGGFAGER